FSSPVHLDSALSKRPAAIKPGLAKLLPAVLRTPASLAEALGVGMGKEEPWSLSPAELPEWRAATLIAERITELSGELPRVAANRADFPPAMIREWEEDWGIETAKELVKALSVAGPLSMRASRQLGPEALIEVLKREADARATASQITPYGVSLPGY